jgi:hypothetical protein
MANWQDVIEHRPFLVFSLVNDDVIVWQNCMAKYFGIHALRKWRVRVHKNGLTTKPHAQ